MADPDTDAFAGAYLAELLHRSCQRRLGLPKRIVRQRTQHDEAHLFVQPLKAAERVEHAVAPEELVGGGGEPVAIGAELEVLLRTLIAQILRDDAILQHASE